MTNKLFIRKYLSASNTGVEKYREERHENLSYKNGRLYSYALCIAAITHDGAIVVLAGRMPSVTTANHRFALLKAITETNLSLTSLPLLPLPLATWS